MTFCLSVQKGMLWYYDFGAIGRFYWVSLYWLRHRPGQALGRAIQFRVYLDS